MPPSEIEDLIYSLDIKDFLEQLATHFSETKDRHTEVLFFSGLRINGYHDTETDVDIKELAESTSEKTWNKIIRGILNIFEFTYLFSITEDHLKDALNESKSPQLIGRALNTNPGFTEHLENNFKFPRNFISKIWDFFVEIRNAYSHNFGYLQEEEKEKIIEKREKLIDAYNKAPIELHLISDNLEEFFFLPGKIQAGKMYLLSDHEVNVFRNFIRIFIPEFAKWSKRIS